MSRIISFSVTPTDKEAKEEVRKLKLYCDKSGIKFSYMMIKAIRKLNKELNL